MNKILLIGFFAFPFCNAMAGMIDFSSATATASGQYMDPDPEYSPSNAIDGDPYTYWNGGGHIGFLTIDMGSSYIVNAVEIENPGGINPQFYGYANEFTILGSTDNIDFITLGTGITLDAVHPLEYVLFNEPFTARYLRYSVSSIPGISHHWAHVGELRAYGTSVPVPEPSTMALIILGLVGFRLAPAHKKYVTSRKA